MIPLVLLCFLVVHYVLSASDGIWLLEHSDATCGTVVKRDWYSVGICYATGSENPDAAYALGEVFYGRNQNSTRIVIKSCSDDACETCPTSLERVLSPGICDPVINIGWYAATNVNYEVGEPSVESLKSGAFIWNELGCADEIVAIESPSRMDQPGACAYMEYMTQSVYISSTECIQPGDFTVNIWTDANCTIPNSMMPSMALPCGPFGTLTANGLVKCGAMASTELSHEFHPEGWFCEESQLTPPECEPVGDAITMMMSLALLLLIVFVIM